MELYRIVIYVIIGVSLVLLFYINYYNKIKTYILKINSIENEIDKSLRLKYEKILNLFNISNLETEELEKIKELNISSFDFKQKLSEFESKILEFKNDNAEIEKNKDFIDNWYKIENININLESEEKFYNENIEKYNNMILKFPSRIVALIIKSKLKTYFDGKDMYDKNIKDFKI